MRIVGGELRGRNLLSPKGSTTRPTSDRAREAIFNILHHAKWLPRQLLDDSAVMDVFAGTGALGLEALSRGAKHAVFVERDFEAAKTCQENIDAFGMGGKAVLMKFDALKPVPRPLYIEPRALVFLDPPYGKDMGGKAMAALVEKGWLDDGAVCVLEMSKKHQEPLPEGFIQRDERDYGIALVRFFERVSG